MSNITSNASCNPSSISVTGKTSGSGTISWSLPTVPAGGVINSCKLTGTCTVSDTGNKPATVTVNGTSVSSGVAFTINLGTGNTTSSVAVAVTGTHNKTSSTITFSNLVYTVTYAIYHTVTFVDWNGTVLKTEQVEEGTSATAPSNPTRDGYKFTGWDVSFNNITSNLTVTAQYVEIIYYTVTFKDWDGTVLKTQQVEEGANATAPSNPTRDGYKFTGWDVSFNNVTSDLTITAQYVEIEQIKIAEYKFNNTLYDLIPKFNAEFTDYTYEDILDGEVTTRTIYSNSLPTLMRFGNDDSNWIIDDAKANSLLEVLYLDTSNIIDMSYMFKSCTNLTYVNSIDWDTSNVTDMHRMFYICQSLTSLDVSNWVTSNVKSMYNIFSECQSLTSLDVSNWVTSNVSRMDYMFHNCQSLTSLDVSNFNTSKVTDMRYMFYKCNNLTSLDVSNFNTSNVSRMDYMFYKCTNLTSLNLSNFNTTNVTNMYQMFYECNNLTSLDISNFDTSYVTDMSYMFANCYNLTQLDVNNWDTSNVTSIQGMFYGCSDLTTLNASNFDTSNVTDMRYMFQDCQKLTSLDVSNWDTSNVTNMNSIFCDCESLTELNVSSWDTSKVTNMYSMFIGCYELKSLDLSNWDMSLVEDTRVMFNYDNELKLVKLNNSNSTTINKIIAALPTRTTDSMGTLNIAGVDDINQVDTTTAESKFWNVVEEPEESNLVAKYTANIAGVVPTFNSGYTYEVSETENNGIYTVEITSDTDFTSINFKSKTGLLTVEYLKITNAATSMYQLFDGCTYLTSINGTSDWDTSNVTDMKYMFRNCYDLTSLDVSNFNTSNVTNMNNMFTSCGLTTLDVSNFNTTNVTDISYMFQNCTNLTQLDVSNFDTSNATTMYRMFHNCKSLTSLDVSNFDTSKVTAMTNMFFNCNSLTTLDVSNFDTSKVTATTSMFQNCTGLTSLNINNWNLTNVSNTSYMFDSCTNLTSISMNNSDYNSVNNVITELPTRTTDSMGTLNIAGVDDISQVDTATAQSKFWNVVEEPDLIEPVDGYIAKNLVSHGDWSYTFNVDWDTQYLDIEVLSYGRGVFGTSYCYYISNNSYDEDYSHESMDNLMIHDVEVESDQNDIDIIRYSKVDGVCIITSNGTQIIPGNSFANDNKMTIKAVIPTEWLKEEDGFMTFNIKITDITPSEEPEEDIIEWTGLGTVATNLSTENDWTYKLNIDWDTQYVEINNIVANTRLFSWGADVLYINNEYDFTTGDLFYCDETDMLVIISDKNDYMPEFYSSKFSMKISKNDGIVFISHIGDSIYEIKNYHLIENAPVLYLSSLLRTSGNSYSTIGEIKVVALENVEEPDNNELIQGDINDETGTFEDEVPNVVKTRYIDISNKKQILVNVLTEDVYVLKCYLYNANKELVKVIDISADKKRMFGLDLQKIIDEVINDGNE